MEIDITGEPPADIFRDRGKYLLASIVLLFLVVCGILLMVYGIVSETLAAETMETIETVALALVVGPGLIFVYSGGKLRAYKRLGPEEKKELVELGRKHAEISAYCMKVAKEGREPIFAEYEACRDWVDALA